MRGHYRFALFLGLSLLGALIWVLTDAGTAAPGPAEPVMAATRHEPQREGSAWSDAAPSAEDPPTERESVVAQVWFRAVDEASGAELPEVALTLVDGPKESYANGEGQLLGVTDRQGVSRLLRAAVEGRVGILFEKRGHLPEYRATSTLRARNEVRMVAEQRLKIQCRLFDGSPVADATVGLIQAFSPEDAGRVGTRIGPRGTYPSKWVRSTADGAARFDGLSAADYRIRASHPKFGLAQAPDLGNIKVPGADQEIVFASVMVCALRFPGSPDSVVTSGFQWPKIPIDNSLAEASTREIADRLQREWRADLVCACLVRDKDRVPKAIEGQVLLTSGWHRFRGEWRALEQVDGAWTPVLEPLHRSVAWGEVEVRLLEPSGRPAEIAGGVRLAQGGELPDFQCNYRLGSRARLPVGQYRLVVPTEPFLSKALAQKLIEIQVGRCNQVDVVVPESCVRVGFEMAKVGQGFPARLGSLSIVQGEDWTMLRLWLPSQPTYYLPVGETLARAWVPGAKAPRGDMVKFTVAADIGAQQVISLSIQ